MNLTIRKKSFGDMCGSALLPIEKASVFCEGLDHPEGLAVHPDGSIWAGGEAGQIYRVSSDGNEMVEVANTGGFILGLAFSPNAEWLAVCDLLNRCVWRLDPVSGVLAEFAGGADGGDRFKIPNYATFARDGTLYVSDSGTFRQVDGRILRFDADHSGHGQVWHQGPFNFANGLALSPREEALYVVCSFDASVERIELAPDGRAGDRTLFARLPRTVPDGLAFDAAGNLYVACYAPNHLYRVTPDGKVELLMDDWEAHTLSNPTNIAFGGCGFDQLFTANLGRWHLTQIDLGVEGARLACHPVR
ncbi:MAG: SMP-30/gluconolactonase/LRE family protein [Rhodothermaceae bacterium]|nr:SMP-30/gluconolactonase/LRE family protein [Rhodothermaceae bacterium]MYF64124.1 SMP-30/gluconolactonase/LRE family protein [Rhodothermaceae bacterium]